LFDNIECSGLDFYRGFLSGWFDADGTVLVNKQKGNSVRLASIKLHNLQVAQRMLHRLGIVSTIYQDRKPEGDYLLPDGCGGNKEYHCQAVHELCISCDNLLRFAELVGFITPSKQTQLTDIIESFVRKPNRERFYTEIESIEYVGMENVYDCTINGVQQFDANGITVHNCSELPLNINGSCLLMSLNVYGYVRDPFTDQARFDYEAFYNDARLAARLMDDIVDLELEHIDRILAKIEADPEHDQYKRVELELWKDIYKKCANGRRIGVGVTGVGDALAAIGVEYGSIKGINRVGRIYETLKFGVFSGSIDVAEELGSFSIYEAKREQRHPFITRLKNSEIKLNSTKTVSGMDLYKKMIKVGRRNIGLLTSAPAGSISFLTQTTSSGEPLPHIEYVRKRKINPSDTDAKVDFVDVNGDKFQTYKVRHPKVDVWMEVTGETDVKQSPWHGCCAGDLEPKQRVKQQAAAQLHIDHAISSTVNLPKGATQKQVAEIYESAWETGTIKGITVYREGCRGNVISKQEEESDGGIPRSEAPERPRALKCDVYHTRVQGQKYFVLVGLLNGDPYEVFAGRNGFLPDKIGTGEIIRKRKGYYIAKFDNSDIELSPITASSSEMEEMVTRLASTALRHGADTQFLVHQLEKVGERGDLHNFAIGVARVLKKYIKDGSEEKGAVCEKCGGGPLVRQQGCPMCTSCGYSRCL
jgi:ribonucleoside-diphosphate reductase alpha chain